ncbi:MAG: alpha/beta fold hydrolase, partial [Pseudomonadota bacterium]
PTVGEEDTAANAEAEAPEAVLDLFDKDGFTTRPIVCPFKGAVDYKPGEISCGLLEVPENREKARPRNIELHYVKIAARQPEDWDAEENGEWAKRDDPIIYLTGGPSVKAQPYVDRLKDHGVRDHRDLYILEQRGVGWSDDYCNTYPLFDPSASNTPDRAEYDRAGLKAMEACFASARARKVDLSGYSTIENARDVEALRRALGYDRWNVWGISYGSILGQAYLKQDPGGIRTAVIDAIVPLQQDVTFHNIAAYYDRTLNILEGACLEDATCAAAFPDFKTSLETAMEKTAETPIEVEAVDAELFPSGKGYFFADFVGGGPFSLFYEQDNYATLPAFINGYAGLVNDGDTDRFRILTISSAPDSSMSPGMYDAIACNDGWHTAMKRALEEDRANFPALSAMLPDPAVVEEQARICKRYGAVPRPTSDYSAVETDIRTLIVEGAMDPITPPPLAEKILPGFSNGTYVEFAFAGHGPTRSVDCAGEFLTKFFNDPNGELDTSCAEGRDAPAFTGRLFETNALANLVIKASEDRQQLAAPALMIGVPALFLVFGAIIYTLAPLARVVNGAP